MFIPLRRNDPELMDAPGLPAEEVADAYRVLERINRQFFGGRRPFRRELLRLLDAIPGIQNLTLLDVGSGSGDLPRWAEGELRKLGVSSTGLALDHDSTALKLALAQNLPAVRGNALRLPFADRSVDLVSAVKFAHHLHGSALKSLVAEMSRVARHRVVILDIRRHWLAYWGFVAWSRTFTRNRLVRFDGPLSVLRGFTREELRSIAEPISGFSWTVRGYAGFQLALVGARIANTP